MAFLTGVNLEGHVPESELRLVPRKKRTPPKKMSGQMELMDMPRGAPVEYGGLLKTVTKLGEDDELEELRRMIKQTRSKMDDQRGCLNRFMSDVRQINFESRNFDSEDIVLYSPSAARGKAASACGSAGATKQLTASASVPALGNGTAPGINKRVGVKNAGAIVPLGGATGTVASSSALALPGYAGQSSSTGRPSSAGKRSEVLRSDAQPTVGRSHSTPALAQAMMRPLDTKALQMPARRAPPGAAAGQPGGSSSDLLLRKAAARIRAPPQACGADSYAKETAELLAAFPALSRTVTDRKPSRA
eukprot:TRINITY_DN11376_c0_g1_i1.p1 TRINITY_DN11376_c0_g1~~TRINITY_DN11376_c0_g1_i1.p1  ORF type:complete len:304 (-),score=60.95 TRINITY_DN11376_c0_g1_i1:220-1131(-)